MNILVHTVKELIGHSESHITSNRDQVDQSPDIAVDVYTIYSFGKIQIEVKTGPKIYDYPWRS